MIKFFRKIRQKLLSENKFSKYLIYAIGEIALVIIGILIALQINNSNEERKSERQFNSVLNEVLYELSNNIKEADTLYMYFVQKDTLLYNIRFAKNDSILNKKRNSFSDPLHYWNVFDIKNHRFQKLILNTNSIPSSYNSIVADLQELYTNQKKFVDMANSNLENFVQDYHEWRKLNTKWYHYDWISHPELSKDEIEFYFSNESLYKNFATHYAHCNNLLYESVTDFRFKANKIYKELSNILNFNEVEYFGKNLTTFEIEKIVGTYKFKKYLVNISFKDNKVYWKINSNDKQELIFLNKTQFSLDSPSLWLFNTFDYDDNDNIVSITRKRRNYKDIGLKVK